MTDKAEMFDGCRHAEFMIAAKLSELRGAGYEAMRNRVARGLGNSGPTAITR